MLRSKDIVNTAIELGYENCGIIPIEQMAGYADKLKERIDRFPEIEIHSRDFFNFSNIKKTLPWAKSIIICSRAYGKYKIPESVKGTIGKYYLTDSRKDTNSIEYKDSIAFENYLTENNIKVETERKFGLLL